jgi:hypothetical protein
VSLKVRTQWKSLDLRRLAGVGGVPTVNSLGLFGTTKLRHTLRLIDADGHRLDIDELNLTTPVLAEIRRFVDSVPQTDLAARILSSA